MPLLYTRGYRIFTYVFVCMEYVFTYVHFDRLDLLPNVVTVIGPTL